MSDLHSFVAFLKNHGSSVPRSPSIRVLQLDELKAIVAWLSGRNAYSEAFSASGSAPTGRAPRERMMPNAYPTTPCPETQEEPEEAWERTVEGSGAPEETLVLTVEEMKFAVWEALTCYILVLFILYGLWRFVLPPALTLFWAAFRTVLSVIDRALDIVDRAIWPIALLTFIL
ncbi:hypothetical protein BD310DRAFT_948723 [Dichomitus squalens]|uniref:Uncharacterized protein n=1 Tax=Dichomitus squalens TaxID=114155 RepID=A0A4V2K824_9APHY|nr:hypothetical protein BD310DRAFT_948723 [Dichomitus squalens]